MSTWSKSPVDVQIEMALVQKHRLEKLRQAKDSNKAGFLLRHERQRERQRWGATPSTNSTRCRWETHTGELHCTSKRGSAEALTSSLPGLQA